MSDGEDPTTWVRIAPGIVAEVSYSQWDYETTSDDVAGKLTGRVGMTRDTVQAGMWGLSPEPLTEEGGRT